MLAVPCHRDEPAVAETVAALDADGCGLAEARLVVCVNGPDAATSPAVAALEALRPRLRLPLEVLTSDRGSKPAAWSRLRAVPAEITVFADADIGIEPGSVPALVRAVDQGATVAAATQRPLPASSFPARAASVPFRLSFGGLAGTLYAVRTSAVPEQMPEVLLDDAWLFGVLPPGAVVPVAAAVAWFRPAETWRDLWRQRRRAEAGKAQLASAGVALAPSPPGLTPWGILRAYPLRDLPAVVALAVVKTAAALTGRLRPTAWGRAGSTKR